MKKGNISVQTENIFPIIKKFLYSDQEIFLRELIANAIDATSKLKTLSRKGEFTGELGDLTLQIEVDKDNKTIIIRDRGIGMTEEEVERYLNQVAFSSAAEFLEKYKDDASIIGHFGLGFYSAFMVAEKVEVNTLSWKDGAAATQWVCEGDPEYAINAIEKADRGTEIVLHVGEEGKEFLEESRISELLNKYCRFLPVEIQFGTKEETKTVGEGDDAKEKTITVPNIINDTHPIWKKQPTELEDEDYLEFYRQLHPFQADPLFWVHLNIDFPFNLTGVLYFPKLSNNLEMQRDKIQLYSNQVYVTDNVKEIVPEFLMLLHGVIDSPDIPLNVSRSYLQSDSSVRKITGYITRKVADKLNELYKKDRTAYDEKWNDIGMFIKYGIISDEKFADKATKIALLKNTEGTLLNVEDYAEKVKANQTNKDGKQVFIYTNFPEEHNSYITAAKDRGYDVLVFDHAIDNHFMQHLEMKDPNTRFVRVDSDTIDKLIPKDETIESVLSEAEVTSVKSIFEGIVKDKTGAMVSAEALSPNDDPVLITKPEFMRRMREMQALGGMTMMGNMPESYQVVVNTNHPLVAQNLLKKEGAEQEGLARHLTDLALLNQGMLKGAALTQFIKRATNMVEK